MYYRIQTLVFSLTIMVSAFLLFLVQPMFAKFIIPEFGGSASVWTTCMLFFQISLVLGYLYSYLLNKFLKQDYQLYLHVLLLLVSSYYLDVSSLMKVGSEIHPVIKVILIAFTTIGVPFFVLSTSSPLLLAWFASTTHPKRNKPYFLYAASNLGSLLALISYPLLVERHLGVIAQAYYWQKTYLVFVGFVIFASIFTKVFREKREHIASQDSIAPLSFLKRFTWIVLAFVPSSLMLGLTHYVTTDIAPVSLFWVIPLALYLISFIVAFSEKFSLSVSKLSKVIYFILAIYAVVAIKSLQYPVLFIAISSLIFLLLAVFFHQSLSNVKPESRHLTEYYLWISVGGMLGGVFNSILAPIIFSLSLEFWLVLVISISLVPLMLKESSSNISQDIYGYIFRVVSLVYVFVFIQFIVSDYELISKIKFNTVISIFIILAMAFLVEKRILQGKFFIANSIIIILIGYYLPILNYNSLYSNRSFYGSLRVSEEKVGDKTIHWLFHGTTNHGGQFVEPESLIKTRNFYYHDNGAFGDIHRTYILGSETENLNIGVMGLGSGNMACFARDKDQVDFFEIDPLVEEVASNPKYFKFLERCPSKVFIGDGRLLLQGRPSDYYDILFMDAFSSDAVPTHLLTQEAVDMYFSKLKPNGVVVFHISNRFLDLSKVVANMKIPDNYVALLSPIRSCGENCFPHILTVIVPDNDLSNKLIISGYWKKLERDPSFKTWTDDFTNLLDLLQIN